MSGPSSGFSSDASGVALQYQILILNYICCNTTSFLIRVDTDSCFSLLLLGRFGIKTVLDTVELQRGLWPNQLLPPVTAQRGCAGFPISDQWVQSLKSRTACLPQWTWAVFRSSYRLHWLRNQYNVYFNQQPPGAIDTFLPSIFKIGVHPSSQHPKCPM